MANFLFWNTNNQPISAEVALACKENDVDVLILAEYKADLVPLLKALNSNGDLTYKGQAFNFSERLTFITRYSADAIQSLHDDGGIAIRVLRPPIGIPILLVALHLPSKLHRSNIEQTIYSVRVSDLIRDYEKHVGHTNSLIMGDLNMDPFEDGMTAADGLHAMMDKSVALETSRTVDGKDRPFFYNPMWNILGDETSGPPGTFYYRAGKFLIFGMRSIKCSYDPPCCPIILRGRCE